MITKRQNTEMGIVSALVLLICSVVFNCAIGVNVAIGVLLVTVLFPRLFTPLSWLWFKVGKVLEFLLSNIILTVIYAIVVVPVAVLRRLFRRDTLQLRKFKKDNSSVFRERSHIYTPDDLDKQY